MIAIVPYNWTRRQLILMSGMRTCLIPLLLLCCAPRDQPVIAGEAAAFVFSAALGITNGLSGSLPMMLAPAKVPATLKEVTGNMMTLSYNVGLTAGSLIGYVFEKMLGPQLINPCPSYPYIPMPPTTTSATTLMSTIASTVSSANSTIFSAIPSTTSMVVAAATTTLSTTTTTTAATVTASSTMVPTLFSTMAAMATTSVAALLQHVTTLPEMSAGLLSTTLTNVTTEMVGGGTTNSTMAGD